MDLLTLILARQGTVKLKNGQIPSEVLPSYVDDVLEGYYVNGVFYEDEQHTVVFKPEVGKIYVDIPSGYTYRYGLISQQYIQIGGTDLLTVKPDGQNYLLVDGPNGVHIGGSYLDGYALKCGRAEQGDPALDQYYESNEGVFKQIADDGISNKNLIGMISLSVWKRREGAQVVVEKDSTIPCVFILGNVYGFLKIDSDVETAAPILYLVEKNNRNGYKKINLYADRINLPTLEEWEAREFTDKRALTVDALVGWFYEKDETGKTFLEREIAKGIANDEVLSLITAAEIDSWNAAATYYSVLKQAIPSTTIRWVTQSGKQVPELVQGAQLVDESYIHQNFDWRLIQSN